MGRAIAYLRVSTDGQDLRNQKLEILEYAQRHGFSVDEWLEIKISSRKDTKERRIDELMGMLGKGDTLIVSELSRLGRSVGQIIIIMDELIRKGVTVIVIKQGMRVNGERDITTTVMVTMLGLFAEIERDLISQRTKAGLAKARMEGKLIGRPRGRGKSQLDGKEEEIRLLLEKGVSRASIAKIMGMSWAGVNHFIAANMK